MTLKVDRHRITIVPDNATDEAYLEEVLGLRRAGDTVPLMRVNAMGLSCWAYAEARKPTESEKS